MMAKVRRVAAPLGGVGGMEMKNLWLEEGWT
jgi:hypothetical protein